MNTLNSELIIKSALVNFLNYFKKELIKDKDKVTIKKSDIVNDTQLDRDYYLYVEDRKLLTNLIINKVNSYERDCVSFKSELFFSNFNEIFNIMPRLFLTEKELEIILNSGISSRTNLLPNYLIGQHLSIDLIKNYSHIINNLSYYPYLNPHSYNFDVSKAKEKLVSYGYKDSQLKEDYFYSYIYVYKILNNFFISPFFYKEDFYVIDNINFLIYLGDNIKQISNIDIDLNVLIPDFKFGFYLDRFASIKINQFYKNPRSSLIKGETSTLLSNLTEKDLRCYNFLCRIKYNDVVDYNSPNLCVRKITILPHSTYLFKKG